MASPVTVDNAKVDQCSKSISQVLFSFPFPFEDFEPNLIILKPDLIISVPGVLKTAFRPTIIIPGQHLLLGEYSNVSWGLENRNEAAELT